MRPVLPVMLFAAGFGTRMAPLTDDRPKPLIEVAGKALIDHALDLVAADGMHKIVANTHYRADFLERHLQGRDVLTIHEPELLETGGGLKNALPALGAGPVITMNTDSVWTGLNPLSRLGDAWRPEVMDALLLLVPPNRAVGHTGRGDFAMDEVGRLRRAPKLVFSGLQLLKTGPVAEIPEDKFSLNLVWDRIAARGRLYGILHTGSWCDVGRPESIALAEALLAAPHV